MPITKGAKKAHASSLNKRIFNLRRKREMNEAIKSIRTKISAGNKDEARALLPTVYKVIDKAAKRGVIKDNTASRKKSRLAIAVGKVQ